MTANRTWMVIVAAIISSAALAESIKRPEVQLGFGGWTVQGDKIERSRSADGEEVIKISGNVLLWTLDLRGKAVVFGSDNLESRGSTLVLKGYPIFAQGETMMSTSTNANPELSLTVKNGVIVSGPINGELAGQLGETAQGRAAALVRRIENRKEIVRSKLAAITKDAQQDAPSNGG